MVSQRSAPLLGSMVNCTMTLLMSEADGEPTFQVTEQDHRLGVLTDEVETLGRETPAVSRATGRTPGRGHDGYQGAGLCAGTAPSAGGGSGVETGLGRGGAQRASERLSGPRAVGGPSLWAGCSTTSTTVTTWPMPSLASCRSPTTPDPGPAWCVPTAPCSASFMRSRRRCSIISQGKWRATHPVTSSCNGCARPAGPPGAGAQLLRHRSRFVAGGSRVCFAAAAALDPHGAAETLIQRVLGVLDGAARASHDRAASALQAILAATWQRLARPSA